MDADGDFTIVWQEPDADGSGIFMRRFFSDATPRGPTVAVNTTTLGDQESPSIGIQPTTVVDQIVVVWTDESNGATVQRYRGNGAPVGTETHVGGAGSWRMPWVGAAVRPDASFAVFWESLEALGYIEGKTFAQRFDSHGIPDGDSILMESTIDATSVHDPATPVFKSDGTIDLAVSWRQTDCTMDCEEKVYVRRMRPDTSLTRFIIDSDPSEYCSGLRIAPGRNDALMATHSAWEEGGLVRSVLSANGSTVADPQVIGAGAISPRHLHAVAGFGESFVSAWMSPNGHVSARVLGSAAGGGALVNEVFQVSETAVPVFGESAVDVAACSADTFVVVWTGGVAGKTIMARVFERNLLSDGFESGDLSAWSN